MNKIKAYVMSDNEGAWARVSRGLIDELGVRGEFRSSFISKDHIFLDVGSGFVDGNTPDKHAVEAISDFEVFQSAANAAGYEIDVYRLEPGMAAYEKLDEKNRNIWHSSDKPHDIRALPSAPYYHARYEIEDLGVFIVDEFAHNENGAPVVKLSKVGPAAGSPNSSMVVSEDDFGAVARKQPGFEPHLKADKPKTTPGFRM